MEADIIEALKERGLVMTEKRIWIVKAICQAGFIPDVETFWLELRETRPVSWSTIHSTLRLMTLCGILQRESEGHRLISYLLVDTEKSKNTYQ